MYSGIFAQYANFGWAPSERILRRRERPLHRPVDDLRVSRASSATVDDALERYDATAAARAIIEFVDDDVANWYVRLEPRAVLRRGRRRTTARRSRRCTRCWCPCAGCSRRSRRS